MSIIFFIIAILILSILLTTLVIYTFKNSESYILYFKSKIDKIHKITFPKIKIPKFQFRKKSQTTNILILDSGTIRQKNIFQDESEINTTKFPVKHWMWIAGFVMVGAVMYWHFKRRR